MTTAITVLQSDGTRKELGGQVMPGNPDVGALAVVSSGVAFPTTNGSLTVAQPVIGTPVAGGTIELEVAQAGNVSVFLKAVTGSVTLQFEASLESSGDTNWFGVQMARTNANIVETTSGALTAVQGYGWEGSVAGLTRFRVRASALTTGPAVVSICQGAFAAEPAPAIPTIGTVTTVSTVAAVSAATPAAASANAGTSAATTNAAVVKATAGDVMAVSVTNYGAAAAYLKLYNKAAAPTVGTDKPALTIPIPATSVVVLNFGAQGARFATGIGMAITNLMPIADATAVVADQVAWNITYK